MEPLKFVVFSNVFRPPSPRVWCEREAELPVGSRVMMLIVPAMADDPNSADPPPRTTSTRSIMLAGICSSP